MRALLPLAILLCAGAARPDHSRLLAAVERVEDPSGDPAAVGDGGLAVGVLQIHPGMVRDCNRIVGRERWTLQDRLSRLESEAMWEVYLDHYSAGADDQTIARRWNGGPHGERKAATRPYWRRVRAELLKGGA